MKSITKHSPISNFSFSFLGDFARSLPDFRVITPYISSRYGSILTYNLDEFSDRSEMFYVIKAFGQELLLEMTRNKRLVASNFASETMLNSRDYFSNVSSSCYFTGKVKGINRSSAAISNCHGLVSFLAIVHSISLFIFIYNYISQ